jgi:hypothetical protein
MRYATLRSGESSPYSWRPPTGSGRRSCKTKGGLVRDPPCLTKPHQASPSHAKPHPALPRQAPPGPAAPRPCLASSHGGGGVFAPMITQLRVARAAPPSPPGDTWGHGAPRWEGRGGCLSRDGHTRSSSLAAWAISWASRSSFSFSTSGAPEAVASSQICVARATTRAQRSSCVSGVMEGKA